MPCGGPNLNVACQVVDETGSCEQERKVLTVNTASKTGILNSS